MKFKGSDQDMLIINTALHFLDAKLMEAAKLVQNDEENIDIVDSKLLEELKDISHCFDQTNLITGELVEDPIIGLDFIVHIGKSVCAIGKEFNTTIYKSFHEVDGKEPLQDTFLQLVTETEGEPEWKGTDAIN